MIQIKENKIIIMMPKTTVKEEACDLVSNVTSGTITYIMVRQGVT